MLVARQNNATVTTTEVTDAELLTATADLGLDLLQSTVSNQQVDIEQPPAHEKDILRLSLLLLKRVSGEAVRSSPPHAAHLLLLLKTPLNLIKALMTSQAAVLGGLAGTAPILPSVYSEGPTPHPLVSEAGLFKKINPELFDVMTEVWRLIHSISQDWYMLKPKAHNQVAQYLCLLLAESIAVQQEGGQYIGLPPGLLLQVLDPEMIWLQRLSSSE
jgi:hypothetical protein